MRRIFTAITIFAATLCAADPAREQMLQRAIDLMESKGDVAKAMPLFEDAARSADKALAARALLYLGQGQERQGAEKARATYERIIKEFGNQTETVAAARKRLVLLSSPPSAQALTKRLVCGDCGHTEANLSPDGRYMVFIDWDNSGDLAVRDMSTGQIRRLMVKPVSWKESPAYGDTPVFSPDQRQIAFNWETGEDKETHSQLRITTPEPGSKHRVLADLPENRYYTIAGWSRDGKAVLTLIQKPDRTWQLAWISIGDGSTKVLKSLGWRVLGARDLPSLSPDGKHIAYSALATNPKGPGQQAGQADKRIYVLSADGSSETELIETAGINDNPVWASDGKNLLFISDRSGSFGIWSVAIQDGKAGGQPALVMADAGRFVAKGMLRSGAYYYATDNLTVQTIAVTETGIAPKKNEGFVGVHPAWSPDGKQIAFLRTRSAAAETFDLVVHSLVTGEESTHGLAGIRPAPPTWLRDGKAILVAVFNGFSNSGLYKLDLSSRTFQQVLPTDPRVVAPAINALSPDGRTLYVAAREPQSTSGLINRIIAVDLSTRQERQVVTFPPTNQQLFTFRLSHDGRMLAISRRDPQTNQTYFERVGTDGTDHRHIYTSDKAVGRTGLAWTHDNLGLLFGTRQDDQVQIMRISVEGGNPELSGFQVPVESGVESVGYSPDGKRLAVSFTKRVRELWVIENLLPLLKK